jgi:hypothetical protein
MAHTRFYDDPCRQQKHLDESTFIGNYYLNQPGNGLNPVFINDPHIRQQYWGANLSHNKTELESDLRGITRKLNRDHQNTNRHLNYTTSKLLYDPKSYTTYMDEVTSETRTTHPAWVYREVDNNYEGIPNNFSYLHIDPQEHTNIPFPSNIQSRIIEKDYYDINNEIIL